MNKKGQALVLFIIILPVLVILLSLVMDNIYIAYQKRKIYSFTKTVIVKNFASEDKNDIIKMFNDNNIKISDLIISNDDGFGLKFKAHINSLMKKILNRKEIIIDVSIKGVLKDDKIVYQKD